MSIPALIQLPPNGQWVKPSMISDVMAGTMEPAEIAGEMKTAVVITISLDGSKHIEPVRDLRVAEMLRDEIASMILDATDPFREQD